MGKYAGKEELHDIYPEFNSEHEGMISHKERSGASGTSLLSMSPFMASAATAAVLMLMVLTRVAFIRPALLAVTATSAQVEVRTDLKESDVSYPLIYWLLAYPCDAQEKPVTPGGRLRLSNEEVQALGEPVLEGEILYEKERLLFENLDNRSDYLLLFMVPDEAGALTPRKEALHVVMVRAGSTQVTQGEPVKGPTVVTIAPTITPTPTPTITPTPTATATPEPDVSPSPTPTPTATPTATPYRPSTPRPTHTVTILSGDGGAGLAGLSSDDRSYETLTAQVGDIVYLNWVPLDNDDVHYVFKSWRVVSGSISMISSGMFIMKDEDVVLEFDFERAWYVNVFNETPDWGDCTYENASVLFPAGETVTIATDPSEHYRFAFAIDGSENYYYDSTFSFTMGEEDVDIAVVFEPILYTLNVASVTGGSCSVSPDPFDIVDELPAYLEGTEVTVTAFPDSTYKFTHFLVNSGSSEDNPLTISMDADTAVTPAFALRATYTITTAVDPEEVGTISVSGATVTGGGDGVYTCLEGDTLTLSGAPVHPEDYVFSHFEVDGTAISGSTWTATGDAAITAHFASRWHYVNVISDPPGAAVVPTGIPAREGETVSVSWEAQSGYEFTEWTFSTAVANASLNSDHTGGSFTMGSTNVDVTAHFAEHIYTFTINADPSTGGEVSNTISGGNFIYFFMDAKPGYEYYDYSITGEYTGLSINPDPNHATGSLTMTSDVTVTAYFRPSTSPTYSVTILCDPPEAAAGQTLTGYVNGATATFSPPTPNSGYSYTGTYSYSGSLSVTETSAVIMGENVTVTFHYTASGTPTLYTIHYNEAAGGTIYGPEQAAQGYSATITAEAAPGYHIASMTVDGVSLTVGTGVTMKTYELTMPAREIYCSATFEGDLHTIGYYPSPSTDGTISGPATARTGETPAFTVAARPGYHIVSISYNGDPVTVTNAYEVSFSRIISPSGASLTATFAPD